MAILAIARTIARKGIKFQSNVQLAAFAGEEQGLLGSKAYARKALIMYFFAFTSPCYRQASCET